MGGHKSSVVGEEYKLEEASHPIPSSALVRLVNRRHWAQDIGIRLSVLGKVARFVL